MNNISKRGIGEKVPGQWLTNCPVDLGKLSLRENWDFLNPRDVHSFSSDLAKAIIRNRKITGAVLSTCLTPTLKSMDVSILPMMIFTIIFSYVHFISEHSMGVRHIFPVWK